jgi:hypothetical protein
MRRNTRRPPLRLAVVLGSLLIGSVFLPGACQAEDLALRLYQESGAQAAMRQLPAGMNAYLAQQPDIPPFMARAFQTAIHETLDSNRTDSTFLARLRPALNEPTTKAALAFLKTKTGRTVTQAERFASTPEGAKAMQDYLNSAPPEIDPARTDLFRVLDAATRSSEILTYQSLAIAHGVLLALDESHPEGQRLGSAAIWAEVKKSEPQAIFDARQETLLEFQYIYRAVTKEELREYLEFANSEHGQEYHRVFLGVYGLALADMIQPFAKVVARELIANSGR